MRKIGIRKKGRSSGFSLCVSKKYFDTFIENLWIFDELEKNCGNLKIYDFPGDFLTAGSIFLSLSFQEKSGSPHMSLSPISLAVLRYVF